MKTAAHEAAFRLLTSLPVRTHYQPEPKPAMPTGRAAELTEEKKKRMRELAGTMSRRQICEVLQVSHVTARKYLGRAYPKRISTAPKSARR